ncbi:MAG: hypothetical protein COA96_17510 [SAR86 cluster bacterium]|uniref:Type 4 fimbrial biogenesis protein PilX N-terminal domain-containing protein n=1 Tax=SAR86 cluster bacterium TaxID=2030880 RepID=A0A2A5AEH0_9GAMM|nr:MAG: hypothetical protein COA96_17510 [SAR86 cluster bacterium]
MKSFRKTPQLGKKGNQRGAILIFCLVFMAILTVMGVSGMETTVLEERMSANMRDRGMAFQAAESALKAAESWLILQTTLPTTSGDGSTTVWTENSMDPALGDGLYWWDHANIVNTWWTNQGIAIAGVASVSSQPRYIIEQYRTVDSGQSIAIGGGASTVPRVFHRITSWGVGVNPTTEIRLQSTFVQSYTGP